MIGVVTSAGPHERLLGALVELRDRASGARLPLQVAGADEARKELKRLGDQLDDYVIPRLRQLDAPLLAVVGGSTGAGKSTLINSLVGAAVSAPGVLRPTTRAPVLVCNPQEQEWFTSQRILPGLSRTTGVASGATEPPHTTLHVVRTRTPPPPPAPSPPRPAPLPVWRCSTRRTSTRSSPTTVSWRPSCWPLRICGS